MLVVMVVIVTVTVITVINYFNVKQQGNVSETIVSPVLRGKLGGLACTGYHHHQHCSQEKLVIVYCKNCPVRNDDSPVGVVEERSVLKI